MTDLVFLDPVPTGFSRAINGNREADFFGYQNDVKSVGDFIRLYVSRYDRWASPKYLAGESYGTPRSVGLAKYLSEEYSLDLNGLMLISTYIFILCVRNTLEPRVVGEKIGLNPFVTLLSMYIGFRLGGFFGLAFIPIAVLSILELQKLGYITLWADHADHQ